MVTQYWKKIGPIFLVVLMWSVDAMGQNIEVEIGEWEVPWSESRPRDPYVRVKDQIWFVGQRGDYVGYFGTKSREFKRYDLDEGTGPHNVIVGEDGSIWYAGNRSSHIGRLDIKTGAITKFMMPNPEASDPHTLTFNHEGDIWFTVQRGNFVGKFDIDIGEIQLIKVPTPKARPYGIVVDSKNRPWICLFGTNKIATVDPKTMVLTEYPLPNEKARPRRIALTSDDMVWYVDYARGYLGRLDPVTGQVKEWSSPSKSESRPYAMTVDDKDRLWFVETLPQPNQFVGFDSTTEKFFSVTGIGSGGGTVRHMVFNESSREIWFGTDVNTVGRAQVP
ncbi:MAG: lyase [Acidobacteriota bacterium]|nr:lyase [Acidobacteriota bacterium]